MKKRFSEKDISDHLFKHYRTNDEGSYVIDVLLPDVKNLFSQYDPAPIHQKEINPDIIKRIMSHLIIFPKEASVELQIHLPKKLSKKKYETQLEQAIRHHFEHELLDSELHLRRRRHKGLNTLKYASILFLTLLAASYLLDHIKSSFFLIHLFAGGIEIGAWVSLWHPIETLLYDWLPLYEDKNKYKKLMNMKLKFTYV